MSTAVRRRAEDWFVPSPLCGGIYQLQPHETATRVCRAALVATVPGARVTAPMVLEYVHITSSAGLNLATYGSSSSSNAFPPEWLVPGKGLGLHAAFLPINESVRAAFNARRLPARPCDLEGNPFFPRVGHSLGAIFLPPIDGAELLRGRVVLRDRWACGAATIDLPPAFYEELARS